MTIPTDPGPSRPTRHVTFFMAHCPNHAAFLSAPVLPTEFIMDTGATAHMSARREWFVSITDSACSGILVGNGESLAVLGQGAVQVKSPLLQVTLNDVQYAPGLHVNLISIKVLDRKGLFTVTGGGKMKVFNKAGEIIMTATLRRARNMPDELYILDAEVVPQTGAVIPAVP